MQSSGERPPELPDIKSLRELLARLERCEQMLPSAQQSSQAVSPDPAAATSAPPRRLPAWRSTATVATSFAAGFALTLIVVTLAMRPLSGDRGLATAVPTADGGSAPAAIRASDLRSSARTSSPSDGTRKATGTFADASPGPTGQQAGQVQPDAKTDDLPRPKLSVAGRLETEIGGTVPLAVALSEAPRADADVAMLVRGVPDDVALSPAWPMGSGVWFVNPVDAGKLRLTLYAAPRKDSQLSIELWSPDGSLIATANAVLVAPPRAAEEPVAVVVAPRSERRVRSLPPTPPATVLASRPEPAQPELAARATPPPPVADASRDRGADAARKSRRRVLRRSTARAEQRTVAPSRRKQGVTLASQSGLVWPGDGAPRPTVRSAPARRPPPLTAARPQAALQTPAPQPSASWPAVAFGQSRAP
jgi:hypothetical protein